MKTIAYIFSASLSLIILSCNRTKPEAANQDNVVCVKTEIPVETLLSDSIHSAGILTSKQMVRLSFKTGGIIAEIKVDEGSTVKKGQLLATLDMTEIKSQVNQARLAFEKASRDLERVRNLYSDTVATLEQLQDATSAFNLALETKNIAEFNQRFSSITAPGDGRILAKLAEEYELVGPGMPVLVFSQDGQNEWAVKTGLADKDIIRVKIGALAEIHFDAFPAKKFNGRITRIAEAADPTSGTFEVEVTLDQVPERLLNGLVAGISIFSENKQSVTLLPPEAVHDADGNKAYVFIVRPDSTAMRVPVTITHLQPEHIAVIESLNKMGPVITSGSSFLEDGNRIRLER